MTTDSSMRSESGLSLYDITKPAPGDVPSLRGILMPSRCHTFYAVYNIKTFFRSVFTSDKNSYLRIVCVLSNSFTSPPPTNPSWTYFGNHAILQAILEDTYIDYGGVRADSATELSLLQ